MAVSEQRPQNYSAFAIYSKYCRGEGTLSVSAGEEGVIYLSVVGQVTGYSH